MVGSCVAVLRRIAADVASFEDMRTIPEESIDSYIVSLEFVYRELTYLESINAAVVNDSILCVRRCLVSLSSALELKRLLDSGVSPLQV